MPCSASSTAAEDKASSASKVAAADDKASEAVDAAADLAGFSARPFGRADVADLADGFDGFFAAGFDGVMGCLWHCVSEFNGVPHTLPVIVHARRGVQQLRPKSRTALLVPVISIRNG